MKMKKYVKLGIGVILFLIFVRMVCGCGSMNPISNPDKTLDANGSEITPFQNQGRAIISTQVSVNEAPALSPYFLPFGPSAKPLFTAYTISVQGKNVKGLGAGVWEVSLGDTLKVDARFEGGAPIYKGLVVNNIPSTTKALDFAGRFLVLVQSDSSHTQVSFLNSHDEYALYDAVFLTPRDSVASATLFSSDGLSLAATIEMRNVSFKGKEWYGVVRSIPELKIFHKVRVKTIESSAERYDAKLYVSYISASGIGDMVDLKLGDPQTKEREFEILTVSPVFLSRGSAVADRSADAVVGTGDVSIKVDTLVVPDPYSIRPTSTMAAESQLTFRDSLVVFTFAGQNLSVPAGSFLSQGDSLFYWVVTRLTLPKWESGMGFWPLPNGVLRTGTTFITYASSNVQGDLQGAGTYALIKFKRENLYIGANPVTTISYGTSDSSTESYPMIIVIKGVMPYGWRFNEGGNVVLNPPSAHKL